LQSDGFFVASTLTMADRRESTWRNWIRTGSSRAGWFTAALLLTMHVLPGCKTADYRGATMPAELRAPPANRVAHMDVAGMVGPGTGTNEINPGDLLEITIASGRSDEDEKQPTQLRVASDGTVDAPPIGPVPVAGLEPVMAEQQIVQAAIARGVFVRPSITLQVLKPAVNRITVLGAVMEPGVKELPKGSSDLARALASAGGMTEEASTKVDVLRYSTQSFMADEGARPPTASSGDVIQASYSSNVVPATGEMNPPQTTRIDLAQAAEKIAPSYSLGDRDVVMVLPQEKQFIHVTGLVHQPNQFELPRNQDVTVLDAIAMAGGVSSPVADKVFVIRRMPDMQKPVVIQVSVNDAKRDGNENLRLTSGDLVSVERTPSTVIVDSVMTLFRVGFSVGGNLVAF
jgi:protein involved in polysaccharide export with SLBB domain